MTPDKQKKSTVLSTVSFRYSIILSLSIFTILCQALLFQSYAFINAWLPRIKTVIRSQEETGISLRVELNADDISVSLQQSSLFFDVVQGYTEQVMQGAIPVDNFYPSFHENVSFTNSLVSPTSYNTSTVASSQGIIDESNVVNAALEITDSLEYSVWYHNNASIYSDEFVPYVLNSTTLDNIFRAAYWSYPVITTIYVGMDNGVMRVYPEDRLHNTFLIPYSRRDKQNYTCQLKNETSNLDRFEHRCLGLYTRALKHQRSIIFGQMGLAVDRDDSINGTGEQGDEPLPLVNVLTLSKALHDSEGNFIGIVAMEVKDTNILNLIELPLLTNGYQFVVVTGSSVFAGNSDRTVAYHRNCARTRSEAVCLLQELEPDLYAHSNIVEAIYNRSIGNSSFSDGTTKWFVTYYPISSTSSSEGNDGLSVVGIVPYGDIEENYVHLKSFMKSWGEYSLIAVACVVVIIFFIMIKLSSFFFKTLINPLHEFNSQAATDFNEGELDEELGNTSRSISFKYKAMEKVKSSFQSLIFILEDVNHQYFCGRFDVAYDQVLLLEHIFQEMENEPGIGVILNNKGNILLKLFEVEDNVKKAHDCFKESIRIGLKVVEDFSKIVDEKKKTDAAFRFHTLTLAGRYCNLGNYYQLVHDYEAALRVYDMSVGLYTQAGDIVGKARATGNIGHTYLAQQKRSKANRVFSEAFQVGIEKFTKKPTSKARQLLQRASMNMGIFYRLDAQYEKARPYFVYALELSKKISKAILFRCYSELVYIYHQSTDPRANSMATLLKKDRTYYETVTPRSIHIVIERSAAMKLRYRQKTTGEIGNGDVSFESVLSVRSSVADLPRLASLEAGPTRLEFAKGCIKFIVESCLSGNDFISLTAFNQQIKRIYTHKSLQIEKETILSDLEDFVTDENCTGASALFDAIQNALITAYGTRTFSNFNSWIVVFTSGIDSASTRSLDEMEDMMARVNVNFIIISLDTDEVLKKRAGGPLFVAKAHVAKCGSTDMDFDDFIDEVISSDDGKEYDEKSDIQMNASDFVTTQAPETKKTMLKSTNAELESSFMQQKELADAEVARRIALFSKRRSTFTSSALPQPTLGKEAHNLDCLFENTNQRKCLHLNSKIDNDDMIRYKLFSVFEEVEINVFDTIMESVI